MYGTRRASKLWGKLVVDTLVKAGYFFNRACTATVGGTRLLRMQLVVYCPHSFFGR